MAQDSSVKRQRLESMPVSGITSAYDRVLADATAASTGVYSGRLPWEVGCFRDIFKGPASTVAVPAAKALPIKEVSLPGDTPEESAVRTTPDGHVRPPIFSQVLKKAPKSLLGTRSSTEREAVLRRWVLVLSHNLQGSAVGRYLESDPGNGISIVSDALGGKSTSTILKRVRFCARFIAWGDKHGYLVFPLRASIVVEFMRVLDKPSQQGECMETVNFLIHVMGVDSQQNLARDPLLQGLVRGAQFSERERKQSRVLSVKEIEALEEALAGHSLNKIDRYAVGVFLFQVYSRARVSDIRSITKFDVDMIGSQGYLEARTTDHKNRRKGTGLGMSLCLVAPASGLGKKPWALSFLEAARDVGIELENGHRGPLLPRLSYSHEWTNSAVSASETTSWLNRIIEALVPGGCAEGLTSHGMKATTLSWLAKGGWSEPTRLILGHHSLGSRRTLESYSRDVQAQPLRELEDCLRMIKAGSFLPDATRSGMMLTNNKATFSPGPRTLEEARPFFSRQASSENPGGHQDFNDESGADWGRDHEEAEFSEVAVDSGFASGLGSWSECDPPLSEEGFRPESSAAQGQQSAASDDPEDSSESDSSGEDTAEDEDRKYEVLSSAPEIEKLAPQVEFGVDLDVYQNPRTLSLHGRAKGSTGPLICGRSVSGMKLFVGRVHSKTWRCKQCMAGRPIRDAGAAANFINSRLGSRQR